MFSSILFVAFLALLSWLVADVVCRNASALRLVQAPNHRSSHVQPTPHGGGIGIVVAGTVAAMVLAMRATGAGAAEAGSTEVLAWWGVIALSLVLALIGLADDIAELSARLRFVAQTAACVLLLWLAGPLPSIELLPSLAIDGWLLEALLVLVGVWWINLFNFMDGIDGLAGSEALFIFLAAAMIPLAVTAMPVDEAMEVAAWAWLPCLAAATAGFLLLNWSPARIFMGDVGSTFLGFVIFAEAVLSIAGGWMSYAAWLVLAAVFVTDATVTLLRRMRAGQKWSQAHRSHAYQRLARRWGEADRAVGHRRVTLLYSAINLFWLAPLAWTGLASPQYEWLCVLAAYVPLLVAAWVSGAGRPA